MAEELVLKWGTLKGFKYETPETKAALDRYFAEGVSVNGAMAQRDSEAQKQALCDVAEAVEKSSGSIINDWTGAEMTAAEAKSYISEYRR